MYMFETFHTMSKFLEIFPKAALLILFNISLRNYFIKFRTKN